MSNAEQVAYWNGEAGRKWADNDAMMAHMLAPIAQDLLQHARVEGARRVLDVGCGGGSETLMVAEHLGPQATVLGVDISAPLLNVARERARAAGGGGKQVDFLEADASTHAFPPASFDLLFSRFGVMFFDDPTAAFANLRQALQPGARLAFSCWQPLQENLWALLPLKAAFQHLPPPEPPPPHAPGPFAFADADYTRSVLEGAGFTDIDIAPHAVTMAWGREDDLATTARDMLNMGPVSRLLQDCDAALRETVHAAAVEAMAPWFSEGKIRLPGAVWLVTARKA
ncbi:methyltransferase domain-containing protein [Haliea sp. E1-2-M8]|uniref:class I SAM-dependent methyltransferase n=1 Tax=Haliea sp. E1-2-M8 TaxID=3064706 RepID=UPI0027261BF4|nr:class I SAM-dependent methyltransferase [Haliea sp. E1-2-M8]MDO8861058.1 methyltransferase domain-containing protein [Haliea sp. E1-2-M8]